MTFESGWKALKTFDLRNPSLRERSELARVKCGIKKEIGDTVKKNVCKKQMFVVILQSLYAPPR